MLQPLFPADHELLEWLEANLAAYQASTEMDEAYQTSTKALKMLEKVTHWQLLLFFYLKILSVSSPFFVFFAISIDVSHRVWGQATTILSSCLENLLKMLNDQVQDSRRFFCKSVS